MKPSFPLSYLLSSIYVNSKPLIITIVHKINFPCPAPVHSYNKNLVSRDRLGRPVPRQPDHSLHPGRIWCLARVPLLPSALEDASHSRCLYSREYVLQRTTVRCCSSTARDKRPTYRHLLAKLTVSIVLEKGSHT